MNSTGSNAVCAEQDNDCPICISELVNPVEGRVCRHKFCAACLERWIQRRHSSRQIATCPICRSILADADFTQQPADGDESEDETQVYAGFDQEYVQDIHAFIGEDFPVGNLSEILFREAGLLEAVRTFRG